MLCDWLIADSFKKQRDELLMQKRMKKDESEAVEEEIAEEQVSVLLLSLTKHTVQWRLIFNNVIGALYTVSSIHGHSLNVGSVVCICHISRVPVSGCTAGIHTAQKSRGGTKFRHAWRPLDAEKWTVWPASVDTEKL